MSNDDDGRRKQCKTKSTGSVLSSTQEWSFSFPHALEWVKLLLENITTRNTAVVSSMQMLVKSCQLRTITCKKPISFCSGALLPSIDNNDNSLQNNAWSANHISSVILCSKNDSSTDSNIKPTAITQETTTAAPQTICVSKVDLKKMDDPRFRKKGFTWLLSSTTHSTISSAFFCCIQGTITNEINHSISQLCARKITQWHSCTSSGEQSYESVLRRKSSSMEF